MPCWVRGEVVVVMMEVVMVVVVVVVVVVFCLYVFSPPSLFSLSD